MKKVLTTIIIILIFLCLGGAFIYSSIEEFIMMNEARSIATKRMVEEAESLRAMEVLI